MKEQFLCLDVILQGILIMPFNWRKSFSKNKNKGTKDNNAGQSWMLPSGGGRGAGGGMPHQCIGSESNWEQTSLSRRRSLEMPPDIRSNDRSLSTAVSRCQSFADYPGGQPLPLPLPLPLPVPPPLARAGSDGCPHKQNAQLPRHFTSLPSPSPNQSRLRTEATELDGAISGYGSGSTSSVSSLSSADVQDRWSDCRAAHVPGFKSERGRLNRARVVDLMPLKIGSAGRARRAVNDLSLATNSNEESNLVAMSEQKVGASAAQHLPFQVQRTLPLSSAPSSSLSSPTRSPKGVSSSEQSPSGGVMVSRSFQTSEFGVISLRPVSTEGSGHNSGHSSCTGDPTLHAFCQRGKRSPERSPHPSPKERMQLPLITETQAGKLSPCYTKPNGFHLDSATHWLQDSRAAGRPVPLPPIPHSASPYASPSIPSSPKSREAHGSENYTSSTTKWQKGKLLGCGTFGNVYKGFSDSGSFCAIKEVLISDDPRSKESIKQLGQEILMLSQLRHPNIVQYFGSETFEDRLHIHLEYVSGGSIQKLLQEYGQFKEPVVRSYTRQILHGLSYLHSMNKVHRDIKGANILVDTNGQVKLADFGMAKHINSYSVPLSFKGSPYWMAPEVIRNNNGYNYPVDIWSLGCTIIEMVTAKPPWSQFEGIAAMFKIGNSQEIPTIPEYLSREGQDFVRSCLRRNPAERPTATQLLESPFARNALYTVRPEETFERLDTLMPTSPGPYSLVSDCEVHIFHEYGVSRRSQSQTSEQSNWGHAWPASTALSPSTSPRIQSRAAHLVSGALSPSPISTPLISSGASTPRARYENSSMITTLHSNSSTAAENHIVSLPPNTFTSTTCLSSPYLERNSEPHGLLPASYVLDHSPRHGSYRYPHADIVDMVLDKAQWEVEDHLQKHHAENRMLEQLLSPRHRVVTTPYRM